MADRTGRLESLTAQSSHALTPPASASPKAGASGKKPSKQETDKSPTELLATVRQDLSEAQQSRAALQTRLTATTYELEKLKTKSTSESKRIKELSAERSQLQLRLRDRDEELRGKAKLLEVWIF